MLFEQLTCQHYHFTLHTNEIFLYEEYSKLSHLKIKADTWH